MAAATTPKRLAAPGKPQIKAMPKKGRGKAAGDTLDLHLERLGVGSGTAQAPTCIWTSRKGGGIYLAGLPMQQTVDKFPKTALQICCFPHGPESRGGDPPGGSVDDLCGGIQPGAQRAVDRRLACC